MNPSSWFGAGGGSNLQVLWEGGDRVTSGAGGPAGAERPRPLALAFAGTQTKAPRPARAQRDKSTANPRATRTTGEAKPAGSGCPPRPARGGRGPAPPESIAGTLA